MDNLKNSKKIAKIEIYHSTFIALSAVAIGIGIAVYIFSVAYFSQALLDFCQRPGEFYEGLCEAMVSDASRMVDHSKIITIIGVVGVIFSTLFFRYRINKIVEE